MRINENCHELYDYLRSLPDVDEVELVAFVRRKDSTSFYLRLVSENASRELEPNSNGGSVWF